MLMVLLRGQIKDKVVINLKAYAKEHLANARCSFFIN